MESGGDWIDDARTVRLLQLVLAQEAADPGRPMPEIREELAAVLRAARERLRRRLLVAEGLDPNTGQAGA
ncbi:MAG TPA: hypothetical protein VGJ54_16760 [Streptosporangiaceae bacterium]